MESFPTSADSPSLADDPALGLSHRAKMEILFAVLLALFLGALDQTIVGVALPSIATDLGGNELYNWAVTIYLWHQVGLVTVTVAMLWLTDGRPVPGLHTAPDGAWLAVRVMWVGVSATLLLALARRVYDLRRPQFPARPTEVIAVRDSDPPSRSRVAAHSG